MCVYHFLKDTELLVMLTMLVVFSFAKGGEQHVHQSIALARLLFVWLALDWKQHTGILTIKILIKWVPHCVEAERWLCNRRVSGSIGAGNLEKLLIWIRIDGLTWKQTVTELYSLSAKGEWQSLRIIQLGPVEAQEWVTSVTKKKVYDYYDRKINWE